MSAGIKVYAVFHLNMSFSSIEESDRPIVVENCYWPLLNLIESGYPLGVEATGLTLEYIHAIDPAWTAKLAELVRAGKCEFIGSGYVQLIGPLVPHQVNAKNQELGNAVYLEYLGSRPNMALVNEQAYSPSLIKTYVEAGYGAIMMDWANPHRHHKDQWSSAWRYYPQRARGLDGYEIPLVWLDSIPFQRFQRYAHDEIDVENVINPILNMLSEDEMAFPLYANDAEIFDYRPGRFATEPEQAVQNEWARIADLLAAIELHSELHFVHPSDVLAIQHPKNAGHSLRLETPDDPIPVKKQPKYNVLRWAATGRDDIAVNTACWRALEKLQSNDNASEADWRELCRLWGSDFRTHITEKRWAAFDRDLNAVGGFDANTVVFDEAEAGARRPHDHRPSPFEVEHQKRNLIIKTPTATLNLRLLRGLAVEGLWPRGDDQSVVRTIPHCYFDDINWGADFYTGHLVAQISGRPQVTDLEPVTPDIFVAPDGTYIDVEAQVPTALGAVFKRVRLFADTPRVEVRYRIDWLSAEQGSIHLGNVTLNPAGFDQRTLFYSTHNGGEEYEHHALDGNDIDHMHSPSFMNSARACVGMTEGQIIFGDQNRQVLVESPRQIAAMPGLVTCKTIGDQFFFRVALSAGETDDTSKNGPRLALEGRTDFMFAMEAVTGRYPF